jgi:hypothetical protein
MKNIAKRLLNALKLNPQNINVSKLYDQLQLLRKGIEVVGEDMIHDFLLMLFVECRNDTPDVSKVVSWMKSRLRIIIHPKDAEMLLKFMKLFRPLPSEEISEYDSFLCMEERDPLLLSSSHSHNVMSKEQWCEETVQFILRKQNEIYLSRVIMMENQKPVKEAVGLSRFVRFPSFSVSSATVVPIGISTAEDSISLQKITSRKYLSPRNHSQIPSNLNVSLSIATMPTLVQPSDEQTKTSVVNEINSLLSSPNKFQPNPSHDDLSVEDL